MKWITLLLVSTSFLFAESEDILDPKITKEVVVDKRENYFETNTPYKISPNVNPITGDLIEEEMDLVVAGCEPLSVRRFYNHAAIYEPKSGGWRYNPEAFFAANFEWSGQETFAAVGSSDGSITPFTPSANNICTFNPEKFTNVNPSGQTHPLNTKISYYRVPEKKKKKAYFNYVGEIVDGSGAKRSYNSGPHGWLSYLTVHVKRRDLGFYIATYTPNCWTPYQLHVTEERRPNGNIIAYSIIDWKKNKHYRRPHLLSGMTVYNSDKTKVLASLSFSYKKDKHQDVRGITATGSDGRQASFQHQGDSPIVLAAVSRPNQPPVCYGYQGQCIKCVEKPEGRVKTTEYNAEGKVVVQYAPVGPNGEMHSIGHYVYHPDATEVYDAEGNNIIYRFNDKKQILCHETYQNNALYRIDRFSWDTNGNLLKKTIEDGSGTPIVCTEYQYDKNHNPILERRGIGEEWRSINRTYSEDGFNLKLTESDRENRSIRYTYVPGTNLLTSEFIYENDSLRKRAFHFYDDCAICIKTIIDDGNTEDSQNLQGVTYRKITVVTPKQSLPCFGLPEIIEEKSIDLYGNEISLSKIVYHYTPDGKISQQDHYDANGTFHHSIYNNYDDQERLISSTDPLGAKTTYTYDANYNLISIYGPKPDQYKEIVYDKANRPIQWIEKPTDDSRVTQEKRYDKLGNVIEEIDACRNTTRYDYDALSRVTTIYHPDGAIERKEYNILGQITKEIDPLGYETTKSYNLFGQVVAIHHPDGTEEHFTYNTTGTLSQHTNKIGTTISYTYDCFDQPIEIFYSSQGQVIKKTSATYTPFNQLTQTDAEGNVTRFTYDFSGRKIAEQIGSKKVLFTYNPFGLLEATDYQDYQQINHYDTAAQLIEKLLHADALQSLESYRYDEAGNLTQKMTSQGIYEVLYNNLGKPIIETNPLGHQTHHSYHFYTPYSEITTDANNLKTFEIYDARGRVITTKKANAQRELLAKTENHYDHNGNIVLQKIYVFNGPVHIKTIEHTWKYGPLNRLECFIEAGEKITHYLYDQKGRLKTIVKPSGAQLQYEYDLLGRVARFFSTDFDYHYSYNQNDQILTIFDALSNTMTTRTYDALGNIIQERLATQLQFEKTFDNLGRPLHFIFPDHSKIEYTYKGAFLYTVGYKGEHFTYKTRDLEGKTLDCELPANLGIQSTTRDALSRTVKFLSPYYKAIYPDDAYDPVGNLMRYNYEDPLGKIDREFAYDPLYQLISENEHTYQFDSIHNRLQKDHSPHTVNQLCQITNDGTSSYAYDLNGNLISDGTRHYEFDTQDRLIAITHENDRLEFTYDPFHRRLSKTLFTQGEQISHEKYLWNEDNEVGILDENRTITQRRILGEGLGAEIGASVLIELYGTTYVPIHDPHGNIVQLIDTTTKQPTETYRYTAFGEELTQNQLCPWRFSSKRTDETGLVFFGRRYYNPTLGNWLTQDPAGYTDSPNLYAFVCNSPLTHLDLYGLVGNNLRHHPYIPNVLWKMGNYGRTAYFRTMEWYGANACIIPCHRNFIESVGRWGSGGDFFGPSRYRTPKNEIIPIEGRSAPHLSAPYANGLLTTREEAIAHGKAFSQDNGGAQIDLVYHGTDGIAMDFINAGISKIGIMTPYTLMLANYFGRKLEADPEHHFEVTAHSRGGIQLSNAGNIMYSSTRKHINVLTYGSGTLIPNKFFNSALNIVSTNDIVPWTNPIRYAIARYSDRYNVKYVTPHSQNPFKAHGFLEETYSKERKKQGQLFQEKYFHD